VSTKLAHSAHIFHAGIIAEAGSTSMQGGDAISIKQQSAGTSFCWAYLQQLRKKCIMMFCADKIWVHVMFYMLLTLSTS